MTALFLQNIYRFKQPYGGLHFFNSFEKTYYLK